MGQPAARITDMHVCPLFTGPVPHVGGPILPPGAVTVLIGKLPAACVSHMLVCAAPAPDVIVKGSMTVLINKLPAARMGDMTAHGGVIVLGCPTVLIGG
ncbi:MAG: PAAR domain-containing protein [Methylococcales bacterium]|nr:PAAR domain-containing protein [Methylococcales bacterium]